MTLGLSLGFRSVLARHPPVAMFLLSQGHWSEPNWREVTITLRRQYYYYHYYFYCYTTTTKPHRCGHIQDGGHQAMRSRAVTQNDQRPPHERDQGPSRKRKEREQEGKRTNNDVM